MSHVLALRNRLYFTDLRYGEGNHRPDEYYESQDDKTVFEAHTYTYGFLVSVDEAEAEA